MGKILSLEELLKELKPLRGKRKIVFTNGCFDLLHAGHAHYLNECRKLGDLLVVGINSDGSVRRIKGEKRPILPLKLRAYLLSNLSAVDYVVPFEEETPIKLIKAIKSDFLVKGGDWKIENIVGADFVQSYGGKVLTIPFKFDIEHVNLRSHKQPYGKL